MGVRDTGIRAPPISTGGGVARGGGHVIPDKADRRSRTFVEPLLFFVDWGWGVECIRRIVALYNHALKKGPHSFLYVNVRDGTFFDSDWQELLLSTKDEPESD